MDERMNECMNEHRDQKEWMNVNVFKKNRTGLKILSSAYLSFILSINPLIQN